jgi:hypothetical protein
MLKVQIQMFAPKMMFIDPWNTKLRGTLLLPQIYLQFNYNFGLLDDRIEARKKFNVAMS